MGFKARPQRSVALLRGINVGGHHIIAMADLREMFARAGASDVESYIQSGNVAFSASAPAAVAESVARAIENELGFRPSMMTRDAETLAAVAADNPFAAVASDPKHLHVGFFETPPSPKAVSAIEPQRYAPDQFAVKGAHVFLHCPNGMSRTRFTASFFRLFGANCTVRNWRTVNKLVAMVTSVTE